MMVARNPYLEMPLPVNVTIDFGFKPAEPASTIERRIQESEAIRAVVRALNEYTYSSAK